MRDELAKLNELSWDYRAARVLQVANKLDIFTMLAGKEMSSDQISHSCGTNPVMTEKLLIGCVALGLLKKKDDEYCNSELAARYLVRGEELYQGDIIAHSSSVWDFWSGLGGCVVSGAAGVGIKPEDHRNFILGMHDIAVAGRAQMFIDNIDLCGRKKLFDVGGGPGTYSIAACRRYRQLRAVVFDLAETIAIAKEIVAKEKMEGRVILQEGDWESDCFGNDNDVVLLSDVMHGTGSRGPMKLKKSYDSMVSGGLLAIQEFLLNDEKTGPLTASLFNIMVGAYSKKELLCIVEEAGFIDAKVVASSDEIGSSWITAIKQ